jgi:predicted ArsR family transcriptional regulator
MTDRLSEQAASIGALAEPVRRALYVFVVAQHDAVSREQAAEGVDVPLHTAKFHLDKLVEEGLLDVEFRRLTGRTGPGAGRPSKLYRRSARELSVSLPERRYDVVGRILAAGVDRAVGGDVEVRAAVREVAVEEGRRVAQATTAAGSGLEQVANVLAEQGYEPVPRDGDLLLANCPFDALAREHTELVCGLNESFVGGVVDGLGCAGLVARLDPEEGLCCVKVGGEPGPSRT